ncbi:MAG TPA: S9 family peptidase [Thermoanaerobaculia bacterium]|nr:S9 family peptidase [Thermoanaerobaculia bacterium]
MHSALYRLSNRFRILAALAIAGALVLSLAPSAGAAVDAPASARGPLQPMDIFELELATDPQISPDGTRVVYVRRFSDVMTDKRCSNLWIVGADGTGHRPLTTGNHTDSSPRWSPDGRELLYLSDREGSTQIHRRFMDTGETARVAHLTESPAGIAWSPDGRWISFAMHVPAPPRKIAEMPAAPEGAKWSPPARVIDRSVYRFNRVGYLEPGFTHVFVLPAEGGTPRQITSGEFHHGGPAGMSQEEAVWTPDGRHLIISAVRRPDWEDERVNTELWEFSVADGSARALTDRAGPDGSPAVSPDGRSISYVGFDDRYQGYQIRRLHVLDRASGESRVVTADFDRDVSTPRWAPDGSAVYFLADERGNTGLWRTDLRGRVERIASNVGSGTSAYGGGREFTLAAVRAGGGGAGRDVTFAVTYSRPDVPGDIAIGRPGSGTPKVLTTVNADLFAMRTLGDLEEIVYPSSKDGREIQGWILKPPDFDRTRRYPLVLEIHGGPFANYGDRFDLEKQLMAARGYVVLYTNPRGSTSYGEEFGNLIHHAYPGDDFHDLDAGVDAVIAQGYVDPEQLFVTGGSGGGVLTCWTIGHTDRYRAAVTVYPVINWYSFNLTADIGGFTSKYWFPGLPWDHVEHYEQRSLLSVVRNVKTPTMVLTGEEDWRTPMSESEQYYKALKLLGVEAVLVRVPDEPHGISLHPSHHMAKVLYILGWFDQHRTDKNLAGQPTLPPAGA